MLEGRLRREDLKCKIMSAKEAANMILDGMIVATSGFTPSGYPKAVPLALSKRIENGENVGITLITGASVGDELDGSLSRAGIIKRRFPYQTHKDMRNGINSGSIMYQDMHLSHLPQYMSYGFLGKIDVAIVEAVAITEEGGIIPSTSVGISPTAVKLADKVIVEINTSQPMALEGMHDIYLPENPPNRKPIPIEHAADRIGTTYIPCDPEKIAAIVVTDITDKVRPLGAIDENARAISGYIMEFLQHEVKMGRLPKDLLPLQSGVGSVANAVLGGLIDSPFSNLTCYTEVLQDSMLDLIDAGKASVISTTAITPSEEGLVRFHKNIDKYKKHIILRPQEISNSPEVARRLGVIAMNTAIEVDIYGHVNSTNIMGSRMMNGIGGSGDFIRNAYLSIFTTVSTAKDGDISSIVPMVSHVDHTEHDVMVVVTEQGLADLRGTSPRERARKIIQNCAHPDYKDRLMDYLERAENGKLKHEPHLIGEALSWHEKFLKTGTMK
ncbi:acetyl-CoA hydrolase/transferase family protein [Crassaminicella thermophila]|uniref:Acetyl-CoA hydrolase/transferase family protein n=1 Tax=Crassaminicella thermophila TaxID=2599308 RepID=A0A5C0SC63_CRATE|nr:acetyl-CoA hydrolase/transferase family protein [Crassaminicella thermophila]QEK11098.1 acetyl-CoA hydrolase/transferase family protein [Crassaminicella thermophila]